MIITIEDNVLNDERLKLEEKFVLGMVNTLSMNSRFSLPIATIEQITKFTPGVIKNTFKSLQKHGRLTYEFGNNRFVGSVTFDAATEIKIDDERKPKEEQKAEDDAIMQQVKEVVDYINELRGTNFRYTSKGHSTPIKTRLKEKYTVEDLKLIVRFKYQEWRGGRFEQYVVPDTLFGRQKFDRYLEEARLAEKKKSGDFVSVSEAKLKEDKASTVTGW